MAIQGTCRRSLIPLELRDPFIGERLIGPTKIVRHHARRFGQSKYGLSRVYKVLLDLCTIKIISSFSERPLLWFATLALPVLAISILMILWTVYRFAVLGTVSLPIAGSALILLSLCIFLLVTGALGEIVNRTAHATATFYPLLTAMELTPSGTTYFDE